MLTQSKYIADYPYAPRSVAELDRARKPSDGEVAPLLSRTIWLSLILCVIFATCDFAVLPLMWVFNQDDWGAVWVYASGGAILAQGGLLATPLVFARGSFWQRLVLCWAAALCFWAMWLLGFLLHVHLDRQTLGDSYLSGLRLATLGLPLAGLAIQAPLWFLRLYRGWQLVTPEGQKRAAQPLSILDYMIGTGIVALSITAARLAVKSSDVDNEYWAGWSIFCAAAACLSLISVAPALLLMLRCRDWRFGWIAMVLYGAFAPALVIALMAVCMPLWQPGFVGPDLWTSFGLVIVFASFAGFLGAGLKAARDLGYSLVVGRRDHQ